jgi:N-acetylglucosamine-6-sulfatase
MGQTTGRGTRVRLGATLLGIVLLLGSCAMTDGPVDVTDGGPVPIPEAGQPPARANTAPSATPRTAANTEPSARARTRGASTKRPTRTDPNIVLVLLDDLSLDLLPTMRGAAMMKQRGASYPSTFVADSLCCVSRTSLLTGQYPHQTGVLTNEPNSSDPTAPLGGYDAFAAYGNGGRSFPVRLQQAGYTTGFVGKFLNRYEIRDGVVPPAPPGWSEFDTLFGSAYDGWGFWSTYVEDGQLRAREHPTPASEADRAEKDAAYAGTVIADRALDFIDEHAGDQQPWFLEVAPYAPHNRVAPYGAWPGEPLFPPAFRDRYRSPRRPGNCGPAPCPDLGADDLPGYRDDRGDNRPRYADGSLAPDWNPSPPTLDPATTMRSLRTRAQMVQSADRMLRAILRTVPKNTYVVLTSDNGFHLDQLGLGLGKGSAYDTDVHVPLMVVGPGVVPGARSEVASLIDLAPTFEDLAGLRAPGYRAGTSLVPTFTDPALERNEYAFVEHTWSGTGNDPDDSGTLGLIPSYVAVRSRDALLVRYDLDPDPNVESHTWEFYDYGETPWERTNTYHLPRQRPQVATLTRKLEQFDRCAAAIRGSDLPRPCRTLRR